MKKLLLAAIALIIGYAIIHFQHKASVHNAPFSNSENFSENSAEILARTFANHENNVEVTGQGRVIRILPDDTSGSRHQRFILKLSSGQTLLIAHNIDLSSRISSLREGDLVQFHGEYEWNDQGGVIHWTHHDPDGSHEGGWLQHKGQKYQ